MTTQGLTLHTTPAVFIRWDTSQKQLLERISGLYEWKNSDWLELKTTVSIGMLKLHSCRLKIPYETSDKPISLFEGYEVEIAGDTSIEGVVQQLFLQQAECLVNAVGAGYYIFSYQGVELIVFIPIKPATGVNIRVINSAAVSTFLRTSYAHCAELSETLTFSDERVSVAYMDEEGVFNPALKDSLPQVETGALLWRDNKNGCLGVVDQHRATVFALDEITSAELKKYENGWSGYYANLNLFIYPFFWREQSLLNYSGEPGKVSYFDEHQEQLGWLFSCELTTTEVN